MYERCFQSTVISFSLQGLIKRKAEHLKHEAEEAEKKSKAAEEAEKAIVVPAESASLLVREATWNKVAQVLLGMWSKTHEFVLSYLTSGLLDSLHNRECGDTSWQQRIHIVFREPTPPPPPPLSPPSSHAAASGIAGEEQPKETQAPGESSKAQETQVATPSSAGPQSQQKIEETPEKPSEIIVSSTALGSALAAMFSSPMEVDQKSAEPQRSAHPPVIDLTDSAAPPASDASASMSAFASAPASASTAPAGPAAPSAPPAIPENVLELLGASEDPQLFSPLNPNVRIVSRVRPARPGDPVTPMMLSPGERTSRRYCASPFV